MSSGFRSDRRTSCSSSFSWWRVSAMRVARISWSSSAGSSGPRCRRACSTSDRSLARTAGAAVGGSCRTTSSLSWDSQARRAEDELASASRDLTRGERGIVLSRQFVLAGVEVDAASFALRGEVVDEEPTIDLTMNETLPHQADHHHPRRLPCPVEAPYDTACI